MTLSGQGDNLWCPRSGVADELSSRVRKLDYVCGHVAEVRFSWKRVGKKCEMAGEMTALLSFSFFWKVAGETMTN